MLGKPDPPEGIAVLVALDHADVRIGGAGHHVDQRPDGRRVAGTRIPVWGLVAYRRLGLDDQAILEANPQLTAEDLTTALRYAEENADEIARDIAENEDLG